MSTQYEGGGVAVPPGDCDVGAVGEQRAVEGGEEGYGRGTRMGNGREGGGAGIARLFLSLGTNRRRMNEDGDSMAVVNG